MDASGATVEAVSPRGAMDALAAQEVAKTHTFRTALLRRIEDSCMMSKKLAKDIVDLRSRFNKELTLTEETRTGRAVKRATAEKQDAG